ncbi:MAG: apolipoprotein N-acyltransferase [Pseudomonadota bacterium]
MNIFFSSRRLQAFALGVGAVLGFAPFGWFPFPVLALALLFYRWQHAPAPRIAARIGFAFGLGYFSAGIGWVYVAMHDYGHMPMLLALPVTLAFAGVLALFPALAGYAQARLHVPLWARLTLLLPAVWVLAELARGYALTGFPWLTVGYSQAAESPLAGYAPLLGVYGVSLVVATSAGLLAWGWQGRAQRSGKLAMLSLAVLWLGGAVLRGVEWTQPHGAPIKAALLQGNIPQDAKFEEGRLIGTLELYRRLIEQTDAQLTILPETALPLLRETLPPSYVERLKAHARAHDGVVLAGLFEREGENYYNSVAAFGNGEEQFYRKNHLVPFGEFIPVRAVLGWLINEVLQIPMSDLARGGAKQAPIRTDGQRVAVDICYEDVFGEEIIRALPEATLLANVTNDAWYGESHAAMQHNQIAQMRALETGRMMLRATNTGVTSIIGKDGRIRAMLSQHTEGVLQGEVQGYSGMTPYARWGNAAALLLALGMLAAAWRLRSR